MREEAGIGVLDDTALKIRIVTRKINGLKTDRIFIALGGSKNTP
jgi:hypothetical protein